MPNGHDLEDGCLYYLQDRRQIVGNCVLWWAKDRNGYTTELDKAHVFTAAEISKFRRDTDIPYRRDAVIDVAVKHVRQEALYRLDEAKTQPKSIARVCGACGGSKWGAASSVHIGVEPGSDADDICCQGCGAPNEYSKWEQS